MRLSLRLFAAISLRFGAALLTLPLITPCATPETRTGQIQPKFADIPNESDYKNDTEIIDLLRRLSKECPQCRTHLSVGKMATNDGELPACILWIWDAGYTTRVTRIRLKSDLNIIIIFLPTKILDVKFKKFMAGD